MKYYAGIGSRETPINVMERMKRLGTDLAKQGYCLRSGGAPGADTAFEEGCDLVSGAKEIYLPWRGFNGRNSLLYNTPPEAFVLAEKFHPNWHRCSDAAKKFHARNMSQVLGQDLKTPSEFIVCWTKEGKMIGGTSQALRVAEHYNIRIINLFNQ